MLYNNVYSFSYITCNITHKNGYISCYIACYIAIFNNTLYNTNLTRYIDVGVMLYNMLYPMVDIASAI